MLKPTNNALDVMRRDLESERRERDAALNAGGTQPEQVVRKLRETVEQQGVLLNQMVELFNRMPQNDGRQVDVSGWSIDTPPVGGAWTTVASSSIPRPANMNRAAVTTVGNVSAAAPATTFNSAIQCRILINGVASTAREGTIENLVNTVRSSLSMGFFHELSGLGGASVTVELQARGRFSAYPESNSASLSVSIGFTKIG